MNQEEVIKKKMAELVARWKGKKVDPDSTTGIRRKIDRMIYRSLKRKLFKIARPSDKERKDIVEIAKEVFEIK